MIASHIACRLGGAEYNLTDDVIREVGRRGGVLGVIVVRALGVRRSAPDAEDVRARASRSSARTSTGSSTSRGSDDHVAIGSDLDGYIKPALTVSSTRGG